MIDIKISPEGDIAIEPSTGDLALTGYSSPPSDNDIARCTAQLAKLALSTEKGDLLIATSLGNELHSLVGYPNNQDTAALGEALIRKALMSYGLSNSVYIESWPPDPNTISFEVRISIGMDNRELKFVVSQALNIIEQE
jgi:hypothetical protein